ncbi:hypothetical protein BH24ACT10_BH24ACT10_01190 [soil metagenome]
MALLSKRLSEADPWAPPLVDLVFDDSHPGQWFEQVLEDGVLCLAAGAASPDAYDDLALLVAECELVQVHLAVRADRDGVFTGPPPR